MYTIIAGVNKMKTKIEHLYRDNEELVLMVVCFLSIVAIVLTSYVIATGIVTK